MLFVYNCVCIYYTCYYYLFVEKKFMLTSPVLKVNTQISLFEPFCSGTGFEKISTFLFRVVEWTIGH